MAPGKDTLGPWRRRSNGLALVCSSKFWLSLQVPPPCCFRLKERVQGSFPANRFCKRRGESIRAMAPGGHSIQTASGGEENGPARRMTHFPDFSRSDLGCRARVPPLSPSSLKAKFGLKCRVLSLAAKPGPGLPS